MLKNKKILVSFLILILTTQPLFSLGSEGGESLVIVPRASWGANSLYNDVNSDYWTSIFQARRSYVTPYQSPETVKKGQEKTKRINDYLNENFSEQFSSQETIKYNPITQSEYAWDLKYTQYVDSIIVHHTHSEYDDDLTGLNQIHKYHSLNKQWGDIGYNYIIGYDGVIYEGREGGDYVAGAHSKYNNLGTVGIAILGNYESEGINNQQYSALESLVKYLTKKYGIDLSNKRYYHMNCSGKKCDTFPLETYLDSVLIGHRDATHTSCPGEKLYEQIQQIRSDHLNYTSDFTLIPRSGSQKHVDETDSPPIQELLKALSKYSQKELKDIANLIDIKLEQDLESQIRKKLQILRIAVIHSIDA